MSGPTPKHPAVSRLRPPGIRDSPRKSSYTVPTPNEVIPALNLVARDKAKNGLEKNSLFLFQSHAGAESSIELKNGSRGDVTALEKWTHAQLAEIHLQHSEDATTAHREKEKGSAEQIKVLDTSAEFLAKMIEVHCLDKARFMRKLWSSSADLFNSIYTELSSAIHDLKLKLSDKSILCTKLEDTLTRMRTSVMTPHTGRGHTADQLTAGNAGTDSTATSATESGFVSDAGDRIRALEQELLLKNQEMMQMQSILTSLSIWFPNFAKFNSSILSKYLPPIDYLEELERLREEEEKKQWDLKAKEQEQLLERQGKSGKLAKQRSTLGVIGEGSPEKDKDGKTKVPGSMSALEDEMQDMDLAQSFLLKDLKRLQGLGVGFAVLDPQEFEAAQQAVKNGFLVANSAGVFPAGGTAGGNAAAAANVLSNPAQLPQSLMRALGRTSVAVTNKYKSRLQNMQSFVEVKGDEYTLSTARSVDGSAVVAASTASTEFSGEEGESGAQGAPLNPMAAAAAAAVMNVMKLDVSTPIQAAKKEAVSPVQTDMRMGDFFKLQNVRVTKVNADEANAAVSVIAKHLSAKNKPGFYDTAAAAVAGDGNAAGGDEKEPDEMDDHLTKEEREYELKYRALLIDAQKLEVATASAERKMKEEKKAHQKQLLRMSAHVTTLQNKLQASNLSANAMLQKIPHVVFAPMIRRDSATTSSFAAQAKSAHKQSHSAGSKRLKESSVRPAVGTSAMEPYTVDPVSDVSALNSLFEQSFGDMEILLNNTRRSHFHRSSMLDGVTAENSVDSPSQSITLPAAGVHSSSQPVQSGQPRRRQWSVADIEALVVRFCRSFTQSSPTPLHNHSVDGSNPLAGMNTRDELFAAFGQGPDQWKYHSLTVELTGQHAPLLGIHIPSSSTAQPAAPAVLLSEAYYVQDDLPIHSHQGSVTFADNLPSAAVRRSAPSTAAPTIGANVSYQQSVFAAHLLQFLLSSYYSQRSLSTSASSHAAHLLQQIQEVVLSELHQHGLHSSHPAYHEQSHASVGSSMVAAAPPPPQYSFVRCLVELFCLHDAIRHENAPKRHKETTSYQYLEHLSLGEGRQQALRQKIFFDIYLCAYQAMQSYMVTPLTVIDSESAFQRRTFAVTATGRVLRRLFTIVGEDHSDTKKAQRAHVADAQSPPWWQCLTVTAFNELKYAVEMTAIAEHRARALQQLLAMGNTSTSTATPATAGASNFLSSSGNEEYLLLDGKEPPELRVDCYECIHRCMNAVEMLHHKLMKVLMNMYRFLQSLSIRNGENNRTFHLLLAHFLQQEYPSVKDVGNAFSITAVAEGNFSFASRTAIVVNLALMQEIQALASVGALNAATFADAVLRSQPNYLVHSLCPLLEPTAAKTVALRDKMIADGTHHLETLKDMLQRAYKQLTAEPIPPAPISSPFGTPHSARSLAALSAAATPRAPPVSSSTKTLSNSSLGGVSETSNSSEPSTTAAVAVPVRGSGLSALSAHKDHTEAPKPSHFKQSYLLNKLLYPEETDTSTLSARTSSLQQPEGVLEEEFLLQEIVSLESLLGTDAMVPTSSADADTPPVRIHAFIQKILLHAKLSYDGDISGVMAPSIAQVALTTWTLQYVVETLLRLRGSSMRLKNLFRKDMSIYQHIPLATQTSAKSQSVKGSLSPGNTTAKHKTARNTGTTTAATNNSANPGIGSMGDYVLIDLLLGDVDLDMFVKVEAHYMRVLQKRVFRAWSSAVEDVNNAIHL